MALPPSTQKWIKIRKSYKNLFQALILVDNDSERSTQLRKEVKMNSFSSNYRNVILIPNEAGLKLIESFEPNNDLRQVLTLYQSAVTGSSNLERQWTHH